MVLPVDDSRLVPIALRGALVADGHTDRSLLAAVRSGRLAKPRRGAYVDGPIWDGFGREERYAVRCRAAQQQASTAAALSHVSGLPFFDVPLWGLDLDDVHLTRLDGRTGRNEAGIRQHRGLIADGDLEEDVAPLTMSATRLALEVTTVAELEPALCVVNDLLHRELTTMAALKARYELSIDRWPGSLRSEFVLRLADPRLESVGETRFFNFARLNGLPAMTPQVKVHLPNGVLFAELDFAIASLGAWFEFDGKEKYVKYLRPGETVADAVVREKRREDRVRELTGWECMRITWWDLEHPRQLLVRIRSFLASVAARRHPAG